ncbi:hypothetical protein NAT51_18520 [Flavobacterium amniphilum]|uniref:hypothetical protein n=1 Tax=Flavobacterium amniphilum TaxID=1834035 RepID=UPI00202A6ADE|nr:hypothetical protein [Flavobacterium amniphilum]MCL9807526.1 hypothetical protein [Flavobacterium amniphilum]
MISILLPIFNEEKANEFYIEILEFTQEKSCIFLPNSNNQVELLYQNIRNEQIEKYSYLQTDFDKFPLFRYEIKNNFLQFIKKLIDNNVIILTMLSHPGGYFARIQDPFFNTLEVICEEFDNDDQDSINPNEWDFYQRL